MYGTLAEALTDKHRSEGFPADKVPASRLGIDTAVYNRWRTGMMVPGDDRAAGLADYLEIPINDMYALLARSRLEKRNRNATMPPADRPVTRADFDRLENLVDQLLRRLDEVEQHDEAPAPTEPHPTDSAPPAPRRKAPPPRQN